MPTLKLNMDRHWHWVWGVVGAVTWLVVASGCAHSDPRGALMVGHAHTGVCSRPSAQVALAVQDQSDQLEVCARLANQDNPADEYVFGYVATPTGRAQSAALFGATLEPLSKQAAACFAAVFESAGLATSNGCECALTVPLVVPMTTGDRVASSASGPKTTTPHSS